MSAWADIGFRCMGSDIRLVVGPGRVDPDRAAADARDWLQDAAQRLSRFNPDSELSALNRSSAERVPATPLLCAAISAGIWAAQATDGLVDPTLLGELETAGYAASRDGALASPLRDALAVAPPRAAARPHPSGRWRHVHVLAEAGVIERPPGVRLDTGGTGKGLLADAVAHRLSGQSWCAVDCGGDIRITGTAFPVEVAHPLTGGTAHKLTLSDGGIATSGLDVNVWRRDDGSFAHHLLDPATGEPAWTGIVGATALAATALEAETFAKHALLSGPDGAREILAERGGVVFHENGEAELIGPLAQTRRPLVAAGAGGQR